MAKVLHNFLSGFNSAFNMFSNNEALKLSSDGFYGDYMRLKKDNEQISKDFSRVAYGKQKTRSTCKR